VEAQVHGDEPSASAAPPGLVGGGGGIPDATQTGLTSPLRAPPPAPSPPQPLEAHAQPQPVAQEQAQQAQGAAAAGASAGSGSGVPVPPLHPELAELLPAIAASPSALTPDVAQVRCAAG
jgi:hypothetical protein